MPQKITPMNYRPAGELKFVDHSTISISHFTSSELGELCDEIKLRNSGSLLCVPETRKRERFGE